MGYRHPRFMRAELSQYDIQEWRAFFTLEPAGPIADFYRSGILAALIWNTNRTKDQAAKSPTDFMLPQMLEEDEEDEAEPEQIVQVFREMSQAFKTGHVKP